MLVEKPEVHHYTAVLTVHARDLETDSEARSRIGPGAREPLHRVKKEPRQVAKVIVRGTDLADLMTKVKQHIDLVGDDLVN